MHPNISSLKSSQLDTIENNDCISVTVSFVAIPLWGKKKLSFTHCGFIGHREHPFQTEGERNHPSAGLLRIFMTGECLSSYSLAGFLQGSPGWDKTLMTPSVLVRGYSDKCRDGKMYRWVYSEGMCRERLEVQVRILQHSNRFLAKLQLLGIYL